MTGHSRSSICPHLLPRPALNTHDLTQVPPAALWITPGSRLACTDAAPPSRNHAWPTLRVVLTTSCLALILTAAAGCGPSAKDRALREANIARSRGDLVGEVLHLRRACELDPDDRDVCERAAQVQAHARQQLVMSAQSACNVIGPPRSREPAAVDGAVAALDGCLAAITRIREVSPGDAEAIRLGRQGRRGVERRLPQHAGAGRQHRWSPVSGSSAWAPGPRPSAPPAFAARVGEARTALAAPLLDLAAAAGQRQPPERAPGRPGGGGLRRRGRGRRRHTVPGAGRPPCAFGARPDRGADPDRAAFQASCVSPSPPPPTTASSAPPRPRLAWT
jgi:hypothetical protein